MPNFGTVRKEYKMADIEGTTEVVQVSLKTMELLEKMFGFTFHIGESVLGFVGKGAGKMFRMVHYAHKEKMMLSGGKRKFQEIVKNKGSLDMAITTISIEDWKSKEGKEFQQYLKNRGVQFVLLDDITKGDNQVQFMFHALDADRVNHLLNDYRRKHPGFQYKTESAADFYDNLPNETKQEVNQSFATELQKIDYRDMDIPEQSVWNNIHTVDPEKKRVFLESDEPDKIREIIISKEYVRCDPERRIAFIRNGNEGFILPLSCIQTVTVNQGGIIEPKIKCAVEQSGMYLQFSENGKHKHIRGYELFQKLRKTRDSYEYDEPTQNKSKIQKEPIIEGNKRIAAYIYEHNDGDQIWEDTTEFYVDEHGNYFKEHKDGWTSKKKVTSITYDEIIEDMEKIQSEIEGQRAKGWNYRGGYEITFNSIENGSKWKFQNKNIHKRESNTQQKEKKLKDIKKQNYNKKKGTIKK